MKWLTIKEVICIAAVASLVTPAAVWLFAVFVHSSAAISTASLALMLPYIGLARWGQGLPDWAFWSTFAVAQTAYLTIGYLLARSLMRWFRGPR